MDGWAYLGQQQELARYWTVIGYMHSLGGGREYLDVRCGEGLLFERFKPLDYRRFVVVDISEVAIEKLRRHNDHRTNFLSADGEVYVPSGNFDVIVFNESLYYLREPVRSLERYAPLNRADLTLPECRSEPRTNLARPDEGRAFFRPELLPSPHIV
jgi:SAM-dependent methyltransferase